MINNSVFAGSKSQSQYQNSYKYSKKQFSILEISMLTAGTGFILTSLAGFGFQQLIKIFPLSFYVLYAVSGISIFIAFILALIWSFRVYKASTTYAIFTISLYCLSFGIGFGILFSILKYSQIIFAFTTTGVLFLVTLLISKALSAKQALTLGKILFVAAFAFLALILITSITSYFVASLRNNLILNISIVAISGLLSIFFLIYNLWSAQNMDQFVSDEKLTKKLGLFIGFQILINVLQLLMTLLRLLAIFSNRN